MSLNKWCGIGRMVKDPNLRQTQSGKSVVSFTIAVERDFKNKDGEREADFINIVAWGSSADFVARYFGKGDMIAVEGRLKIRNWTDENGANRKTPRLRRTGFTSAAEKAIVMNRSTWNLTLDVETMISVKSRTMRRCRSKRPERNRTK